MSDPAEPLRADAVRKAISDAFYESRNEGRTMENAADRARDAVMALDAARQSAPATEDEVAALRHALEWMVRVADANWSTATETDLRDGIANAKSVLRRVHVERTAPLPEYWAKQHDAGGHAGYRLEGCPRCVERTAALARNPDPEP